LAIDRVGSVWVTDAQGKDGKGQQVFKFSPDGKILMTLGKAGVAGTGPDTFNGPSDVVIAPNGDIFVADGHGGDTNERIVKFSKDGKFVKAWGKQGSGPGEFDSPHSIAMDSKGRLFVADRSNNRIQIFDQDGKFLDQWKQFGRPSGISISKDDTLYSVDSQSDEKVNPGFKRGIRIGSAKDGVVKAFIPDLSADPAIALAEGVAADAKGDVYAAGVSSMGLHKFVKK
jgi:DNA-binding beta-propeller fold protein YncE